MATTLSDDALTAIVDWGLLGDDGSQLPLDSIGLLDDTLAELSGGGYGRINRFLTTISAGVLTWDGSDPVFTCPTATVRYAALFRDPTEPTPDLIIPLDSDANTTIGDTVTLTSLSLASSFSGDITGATFGQDFILQALTHDVLSEDQRLFQMTSVLQDDMDDIAFSRPSAGVLETGAFVLTGVGVPITETIFRIQTNGGVDTLWQGNVAGPITTVGTGGLPATTIEFGTNWLRCEVAGV